MFFCYLRDFCFALDSFCSLVPGWTAGPVLLWVIGMSNIVHALVLSSTGIAVCVALARFHSFGEADAGLHFLPTAWTIWLLGGGWIADIVMHTCSCFAVGFNCTCINK